MHNLFQNEPLVSWQGWQHCQLQQPTQECEMAQDFDPHILATMTEEERASILEEQSPEEKAAIVAIDTGSENGPDEDDDENEDEDEDEDDEGADPVIAAPAIADPAPDKAQAPAEVVAVVPTAKEADPLPELPEKAFQPHYQATLPDDFDAQEAAIKSQADALAAEFKDGVIDFEQYRVQADALNRSERSLNEIRLKASLSQEMTAQTQEQEWAHTVNKFLTTTAKADLDYSKDPDKHADLDMFVKSLANDAKNSDQPAEWFLLEAHKRVKALHGLLGSEPKFTEPGFLGSEPKFAEPTARPEGAVLLTAAKLVSDPNNPVLPATKASRKPPLDAVPKTLAQVPGSDGPGDVDGNEFSDVDRLTGDAMEAAIAKMSAAQRDRYMAGV
jgi:hypothetical protein